jgi:glutamate-1-semialdehyde aminotransferase
MDFGVNLFGHRAPFIEQAIGAQLERGLAMAPRAGLLGDTAGLLCRLTRMDRAVFCQSGTEAVMTAVRLARLATGRPRIVIFSKSYHGHSDGLLATFVDQSAGRTTVPAAAGITAGAVAEVIVLDYDDPASLEAIRGYGGTLAAVLVEPVQSRALHVQPQAFLKQLRDLTREIGALLIFDEMITGFRIHAGGVQAHFGVEADLATYGKTLGGGLQIAAVAGRGRLLDGIDGGLWRFGDSSVPAAETTFFAGTFNGNPLAVAAAHAVLSEIERRGPAFQAKLNARADRFAGELNAWLEAEGFALRLINFGSMFRFSAPRGYDLLFCLLLERGVFVWEGRNCFLSDAHDEAALDFVADAVRQSVLALRDGGLLPDGAASSGQLPLSEAQRQLWLVSQLSPEARRAYVEEVTLEIEGDVDEVRLGAAISSVVARHEALRTTFAGDGRHQQVRAAMAIPLATGEAEPGTDVEAAWRGFRESLTQLPFDLAAGPLLRLGLFRLDPGKARLCLVAHHLVIDGWSLGVILSELLAAYEGKAFAAPARQFREHLAWLENGRDPAAVAADEAYWREALDPSRTPFSLPGDKPRPAQWGWKGASHRVSLSAARREALQKLGARHRATLFETLMAAWLSYLHRLTGEEDIVIGVPVLGRAPEDQGDMVGYATNLVPIRSRLSGDGAFGDILGEASSHLRRSLSHAEYPYARLLRLLDLRWRGDRMPLISTSFNLDRPIQGSVAETLRTRVMPADHHAAKMDLSINLLDLGGELEADFIFARSLYSEALIERLGDGWLLWIDELIRRPELPLSARRAPPLPTTDSPKSPQTERPAPVAPSNDIERRVLEHWRELLGVEDLGLGDNFFEAGGHSLMADEAVQWARRSFGVDIALREIFDRPTLADFAATIAAAAEPKPAIGRLAREAFKVPRSTVQPAGQA